MPKRIPEETKQRAIRLVLDHLDEYPNLTAACETVGVRNELVTVLTCPTDLVPVVVANSRRGCR